MKSFFGEADFFWGNKGKLGYGAVSTTALVNTKISLEGDFPLFNDQICTSGEIINVCVENINTTAH